MLEKRHAGESAQRPFLKSKAENINTQLPKEKRTKEFVGRLIDELFD